MSTNKYKMQIRKFKNNKGFTLVELMVSVSIFAVVMILCMGAILTVLDSNRKSQSVRAVMDNLSYSLEGMTRAIRFGSVYHCGAGSVMTTQNCAYPNGSNTLSVLDSTKAQHIKFWFDAGNKKIVKTVSDSLGSGAVDYDLTSPDVTIQSLTFYTSGTDSYPFASNNCASGGFDCFQPKVIVVIKGFAGTKPSTQTAFSLETTLSQRAFDF